MLGKKIIIKHNRMSSIKTNTEISTTKIETLSFVDNGLIVTKNNKKVTTILFSD
jgi:hypothetical protein